MSSSLDRSYAACRVIARRAAKNFFYSFLLLPGPKRRAMYALYAFLRHTDDLADSDAPVAERAAALQAWRAAFDEALAGRSQHPILPAVADTVEQFSIPVDYLTAAITGVEMDLRPVGYATYDELAVYCHHVASVVGLSCIHVWGFSSRAALEPARRCGLAFQLTNILRDLGEDARAGRVYLPVEDMQQFGYTREDLIAGVADERFRRLIEFEAARAEQLYADAAPLAAWLEPEGRAAFVAMYNIYHAILSEVRRRPETVLVRRLSLPAWRKAWLMVSALPLRFGRRPRPVASVARGSV
ncbi:MAG: phytoene/squalene synthase family protein [Pirellulales bacterium]|nr:phytoene/squalene synthase family protein [Pirellulales bacterium]